MGEHILHKGTETNAAIKKEIIFFLLVCLEKQPGQVLGQLPTTTL